MEEPRVNDEQLEDVCLDCCDTIKNNTSKVIDCKKCGVSFLLRFAKTLRELNQAISKYGR